MNPYDTFSLLDTQWQRFVSGLLIVVATLFHYDTPAAFAAAGALDASFDIDGIRVITRPGNDRGQAVAIQPTDGKIVIAGYTSTFGSDDDVMVVRLDSNGSLDSTFNGGQARVVSRFGNDRVFAAALQSDIHRVLLAGLIADGLISITTAARPKTKSPRSSAGSLMTFGSALRLRGDFAGRPIGPRPRLAGRRNCG